MLVRDKDSAEGYKHICNDSYKYTKEGLKERLPIYLHDITAYTLIKTDETKSGYKMVRLKYCPYCGVEIETDERG